MVFGTVKNGVVVVDTVCPAYNETALTQGAIENFIHRTICFKDDACNKLLRNSPQKRFIQPEDTANTVIIQDTYKYLDSLVRGNNDLLRIIFTDYLFNYKL